MGKFKVGDEVKVIRSFRKFDEGEVAKVLEIDIADTRLPILLGNENKQDWVHGDYLELTNPKITKKQRIETLEKEVSELKLIVHELRERKPSVFATTVGQDLEAEYAEQVKGEPSTDDVIEFEGAKYRKVEREAREGDQAIFVPTVTVNGRLTAHIHEVAVKPKSPNQLRAEIIEKAKGFFDVNGGSEFVFSPVANERSIFCWKVVSNGYGFDTLHGLSNCHPTDVFNEHIGKAIALGRAKKLDVSEFENAVQPNEVVVGHKVSNENTDEIHEITSIVGIEMRTDGTEMYWRKGTLEEGVIKIINDTNAQYGA